MLDKGEKSEQEISQSDIGGSATSINISKIEKVEVNNYITIIKYDEKNKGKEIKAWEAEKEIFSFDDSNIIDIIKEDLKHTEEIAKNIKEETKNFFFLLPPQHKGFFINALRIIKKEENLRLSSERKVSKSTEGKESKEMIELLNDLETEMVLTSGGLPEDYHKIYNIIRSKDLNKKVLPKVQELFMKHGNIPNCAKEFNDWWTERLRKHPYAVFVHNQKSSDLKTEILGKIENSEKMDVEVFARGSFRIKMAELVCTDVVNNTLKGYEAKPTYSKIGLDDSVCITFVKKA